MLEGQTDPRARRTRSAPSPAALRRQYRLEKQLAERLRCASPGERPSLYGEVYDELFARVKPHLETDERGASARIQAQLRLMWPYLGPGRDFLEVGAGDGALTKAVAPHVGTAYALEVSREIAAHLDADPSVELLVPRGGEIPLADDSIDFAYSYQVVEHLHPDDARAQFRELSRVLRPGGAFLCITPNRLSGPHDISRHFDREATGLHLCEYTLGELSEALREAGFATVSAQRTVRGRAVTIPAAPIAAFERALGRLPWRARARIARSDLVDRALDIYALARMP